MRRTVALLAAASGLVVSNQVFAQGSFVDLSVKDPVKWIDETPQNPEEYVGRIFVVKDGNVVPHYRALTLPVEALDTPSIKKSQLVSAKSNASVSFADIVSVKASVDSVYEFQNVNTRVWSAKSKDPGYVDAINQFRNESTTAPLFEDREVEAVLMCVGVVQKKVWYRAYTKAGFFASATYFLKVDGDTYNGSEQYEEVIKYGLLMRPIKGYGISLPKTVVNSEEIKQVIDQPKAVEKATKALANIKLNF